MTLLIHLYKPPSTSRGVSSIHTFSPLIQFESTAQNIALQTAGCTMPFSCFRFASSLKTIEPNFWRLRYPSGRRMSSPKVLTIFASAGVPGSTTWRAMTSASIMGMPKLLSWAETVDFPVAMPPVRPMTARSSDISADGEREWEYPTLSLLIHGAILRFNVI